MLKPREIICYFAIKHEGDWDAIYLAVTNREPYEDEEVIKALANLKCNYVTLFDDEYPLCFKKVFRPPFVLFYYGNLSLCQNFHNCLAVVGSRECTNYGIESTQKLIKDAAKKYTIVSGLALGIDAIAHRSAIDNGGSTIAILGSGIDYVYPKENYDLYLEIKKNHLLMSEYPNSTIPKPTYFPKRNRIIAMIARAILVTEAYPKSGTLITVSCALSGGKDVLAVPYPIGYNSECNRIIKDGGFLVDSIEDIYEIMDKQKC
jgi:DNA processing protein